MRWQVLNDTHLLDYDVLLHTMLCIVLPGSTNVMEMLWRGKHISITILFRIVEEAVSPTVRRQTSNVDHAIRRIINWSQDERKIDPKESDNDIARANSVVKIRMMRDSKDVVGSEEADSIGDVVLNLANYFLHRLYNFLGLVNSRIEWIE